MKDKNCEHVKCLNCKNEWCFSCSVDLIPIQSHGAHYHRRDCKIFNAWIDYQGNENLEPEFNIEKCERCKTKNVPCQRPILYAEFCQNVGFPAGK